MPKIKLGINKYHLNKEGKTAVRVEISAKSKQTYISLPVYVSPDNWDNKHQTILPNEPKFKQKNKMVENDFDKIESKFTDLYLKGRLPNNVYQIRELLSIKSDSIPFDEYFEKITSELTGNTKTSYKSTASLIRKFHKGTLYFEDITPSWLEQLERFYLKKGSQNGLAVYMRNIRKVYNHAINNNVVSLERYPFRRYKIKTIETNHRNLTINDFRKILHFSGTDTENWARDMFLLSFFLIGINTKDLYNLEFNIEDSYVSFNRAKTKKLYKIRLEPEAVEIFKKYEDYKLNLKTVPGFTRKINNNLKNISEKLNIKGVTTYYARHSWATFASELDIPRDTISAALGHSNRSVTDTYINFNKKKIDIANRTVIDYVLQN